MQPTPRISGIRPQAGLGTYSRWALRGLLQWLQLWPERVGIKLLVLTLPTSLWDTSLSPSVGLSLTELVLHSELRVRESYFPSLCSPALVKFEKEKIEGKQESEENQISEFGGEDTIRNSSLSTKARRAERAGKLGNIEQSNLREGRLRDSGPVQRPLVSER